MAWTDGWAPGEGGSWLRKHRCKQFSSTSQVTGRMLGPPILELMEGLASKGRVCCGWWSFPDKECSVGREPIICWVSKLFPVWCLLIFLTMLCLISQRTYERQFHCFWGPTMYNNKDVTSSLLYWKCWIFQPNNAFSWIVSYCFKFNVKKILVTVYIYEFGFTTCYCCFVKQGAISVTSLAEVLISEFEMPFWWYKKEKNLVLYN